MKLLKRLCLLAAIACLAPSCLPVKEISRNTSKAFLETSAPDEQVAFSGLFDLLQQFRTLNVLIIHGIGPTKDQNYADQQLVPQIVEALQPHISLTRTNEFIDLPSSNSAVAVYEYEGTLGDEVHQLRFFAVHWSCVTEPLKRKLNADDKLVQLAKGENDRLIFSEVAKRAAINENFSEAFAYADSVTKNQILLPVRRAMELMSINGSPSALGELPPRDYQRFINNPSNLIPLASKEQTDFAFVTITRSFGGKVIFDAVVNDLLDVAGQAELRFCGYSHQIFMLSNQLSLLNNIDDRLGIKVRRFAEKHENLCGEAVQIIAFSDVFDILTYNIPEELTENNPMEIINISVSNTSNYYSLRKRIQRVLIKNTIKDEATRELLADRTIEIADILQAHEGYPNNVLVHYLMANGYQGPEGEINLEAELEGFPVQKRPGQINFAEIIRGKTDQKCLEDS